MTAVALSARHAATAGTTERRNRILLLAFSIYVLLWVFEGAGRKWIPPLADPLYIARDLLIVAMAVYAWLIAPARDRAVGSMLVLVAGLGLLSFGLIQSIILGISPAVVLAGFRNIIAPVIPLYLILRYRPPGVVERMSLIVLCLAPLQAVIATLQVLSPAGAWINSQVGSEEAYFTSTGGIVRATGTFIGPSSLAAFVVLALAIALAEATRTGGRRRLAGVILLLVLYTMAISGSRGMVLTALPVLVVFVLRQVAAGGFLAFRRLIVVVLGLVAAITVSVFALPRVAEAFFLRFSTASDADQLDTRILGSTFGFFARLESFLGDGLGTHGNIGAALGSTRGWIEDEPSRWVAELGAVGLALCIARLLVAAGVIVFTIGRIRSLPPMAVMCAPLLVQALAVGMGTNPSQQAWAGVVATLYFGAILSSPNAHKHVRER